MPPQISQEKFSRLKGLTLHDGESVRRYILVAIMCNHNQKYLRVFTVEPGSVHLHQRFTVKEDPNTWFERPKQSVENLFPQFYLVVRASMRQCSQISHRPWHILSHCSYPPLKFIETLYLNRACISAVRLDTMMVGISFTNEMMQLHMVFASNFQWSSDI
ncbi:hypothetical protein GOBAR_AA00872 [Gossypium barbadense]|uniref:Uncharacterized protein n=1 Tax=Gossypium barbadense TaxID=3634 RepID=A0A2P5YVR6_GOSBA|nr:hypothetical protein GOBAR_AA00872 [Gossypium barbadense]